MPRSDVGVRDTTFQVGDVTDHAMRYMPVIASM